MKRTILYILVLGLCFFGAKEAGEGLTNPTAGALGNAVYHAAGISIKNLPITSEKVLDALREKNEKKEEKGE